MFWQSALKKQSEIYKDLASKGLSYDMDIINKANKKPVKVRIVDTNKLAKDIQTWRGNQK